MLNNYFHIVTLGCKLNIYESESISYILQSNGFFLSKNYNTADIVIINTCTVTVKADSKCRNTIRKIRRINPQSLIIVCGCLVNTNINDLLSMSEVNIFIENKNKDRIFEIIEKYKNKEINSFPYIYKNEIDGSFNFHTYTMSKHSRYFIKIQDGCDNYCSYCKIPYARGQSRSRDIDSILIEIDNVIKNNYNEVILTGINIGSYNFDNMNFNKLLYNLANKYNSIRFRISSIEPQYVNDDFLNVLSLKNICSHLHIPLQSGNDKILKLMNRKYLTSDYYDIIKKIRNIKKDVFLSTDLIIGFPDETDENFENTLEFINKIEFAYIHLFGFSPRIGTQAYSFKPKVPERIRDERIDIIRNNVLKTNLKYRENFINKKLEVIIEKKIGNTYTGKSDNYLDFLIYSNLDLKSKNKYNVLFTKIENEKNIGIII